MTSPESDPSSPLLVACLCAEWCGVCNAYTQTFEALKARFPGVRFVWIDVEDEEDLIHPLEVKNFPTLLIAVGDQARFFGPLRPQIETVERLIRAHLDDADAPALAHPDVAALATRLSANPRSA